MSIDKQLEGDMIKIGNYRFMEVIRFKCLCEDGRETKILK